MSVGCCLRELFRGLNAIFFFFRRGLLVFGRATTTKTDAAVVFGYIKKTTRSKKKKEKARIGRKAILSLSLSPLLQFELASSGS